MSRFKLLLIDESPTGIGAELLFATDELFQVERIRATAAALKGKSAPSGVRAGAKGRQVVVLGKSEESEAVVESGDIFQNAYSASIALGYGYNAVAQELRKAELRGETTVEVRGVELRYADTLGRIE